MSTNMQNVGIWAVGTYLPEIVRTNDWWPKEIVDQWRERASGKLDRPADDMGELSTEGARLVLEAMAEIRDDPFKGSRERRIMPDEMFTSEMEIAAAKDAIERSGIDPQTIDLFLSTTTLPDYLLAPNSCKTHDALRLKKECLTLQTEGLCNAFQMQLALAEGMIKSGQARIALLVQSSGASRLHRREDPMSAWFGDGATAEIVGPVSEGYGVLGRCHRTDGEYYGGPVCGVPEKRWYEGAVHGYIMNPRRARGMLLEHLHQSKFAIARALEDAGYTPDDVDFYSAHQGFAWIRKVTQKLSGMGRARYVDTFPFLASIFGGNLPIILSMGERDRLLRSGDLVALFSGGAGAVMSSMVLRWGRG